MNSSPEREEAPAEAMSFAGDGVPRPIRTLADATAALRRIQTHQAARRRRRSPVPEPMQETATVAEEPASPTELTSAANPTMDETEAQELAAFIWREEAKQEEARAQEFAAVRALAERAQLGVYRLRRHGRLSKPLAPGREPWPTRSTTGVAYYNEDRRADYAARAEAAGRTVRPYRHHGEMTPEEQAEHAERRREKRRLTQRARRAAKA